MKKNILKSVIVCGIIALCLGGTALANPIVENSDLMTRIVLDPSLKPDNSPGVIMGTEVISKAGAETAFANYLLQMLAGGLITVAAPVAIIIIAIGGLIAVISHGDQKLMDKAKKTVTWAIVGLLVIIFSWIIIRATISVLIDANPAPATTTSAETQPSAPPGAQSGDGGLEV